MKNEQTKKEYSAPEMEVVELQHEGDLLLICSNGECPPTCDDCTGG